MREVLTVRVRIKETYEVHGQRGLARMILFDGEGEGSGFYGKILPGGVDTQQVHDDGKLELSARYMLEGTDGSGKSCLVFIENVGIANDKGYIEKTHPKIRTNSTTLSWLETSVLLGTISAWEKGVIIHIYKETNKHFGRSVVMVKSFEANPSQFDHANETYPQKKLSV